MLFYKMNATIDTNENFPQPREQETYCSFAGTLSEKSESYYQKNNRTHYFFAVTSKEKTITFGAIFKEAVDVENTFYSYLEWLSYQPSSIKIEEITFHAEKTLLATADRNEFIEDDYEILELFEIDDLRRQRIDYNEILLNHIDSKDKLTARTKRMLMEESLLPEIERIYEGRAANNVQGHPVHYFMNIDSDKVQKSACEILLTALYANNRIQSRRYCYVTFDNECYIPDETYDCLYKSCGLGAIVVQYTSEDDSGDNCVRAGKDVILKLCDTALKYKNDVLTIFCLPAECTKVKQTFLENLNCTALIELYEDVVYKKKSRRYLQQLAEKNRIDTDTGLFVEIESSQKGFRATELNKIFDEWYDKKLRTTVYPQYKEVQIAKAEIIKSKPKGNAIDELNRMIGLKEAKKIIEKALNYYKVQKLYKDKGIFTNRPAMHMVFTGNPGTAKTTVARLFAEIMKDNGLLSKGNLYEVGRSDLVGKYVGWTAQIVKDKFRAARGSVLFIDEAYSLVEDKAGMYGDEAINTIVQEMENNRDNMVVIFAGYPDKMEDFLQRNPGLRSRIAFHVPFEDYNADELTSIADLIAQNMGMHFDSAAHKKLHAILEEARTSSDFGNGRYVRNLVEQSQMEHASRLIHMNYEEVTSEIMTTLCEQDIPMPERKEYLPKRRIGFVCC